ncbi:MAG TPA: peptidoglycan DD-metalloendopeptidase family protein [Gemmatimonadales bacterium]|nr:peptidoglycan DD-metalloendopeptidase family protein [Gemmatimonadales bacterium]
MRLARAGLALGVLGGAVVLAFTGRWPWRRLEVEPPIPVLAAIQFQVSSDTLQRGETLGDLFGRQGMAGPELPGMLKAAGLDPRRLRAGFTVQFRRVSGEPLPVEVLVRTGPAERLALLRTGAEWTTERRPVSWTTQVVRIEGPIESSLYDALHEAVPDGLFDPDNRIRLAWDLADVYAWSLDFNRDIQDGDRFAVLVEREVSEEGEVRVGRVLAADLLASGKHLNAYRFEDGEGRSRFFDEDGTSLRRAFLRAPVEFRRISSGFTRKRFHPVLGIWRKHEGTDYSAGSGTPVMAAGDGTILRAGRAGGYGNLVEIRHRSGITTRYAHLRGFAKGVGAGRRVSQGQVIGYVGSTGLASGAHLHYEFRVNGAARDSRRVDLGGGEPLPKSLMPSFQQERERLARALGATGTPVATVIAE